MADSDRDEYEAARALVNGHFGMVEKAHNGERLVERIAEFARQTAEKAVAGVLAERDRFKEEAERGWAKEESVGARFLAWRGIETPCKACSGCGSRAYGSTATWHGGIGGRAITSDICDKCWGSGDAEHSWTNLRALQGRERELAASRSESEALRGRLRDAERARDEAREGRDACRTNATVPRPPATPQRRRTRG